MTENGKPLETPPDSDSKSSSDMTEGPVQPPLNMVTPVTVHQSWEEAYRIEQEQDPKSIDFKEYADGRIVISKESMEVIQRKLNAAAKLKKRHLKVLKAHEQLLAEHEGLLHAREQAPAASASETANLPVPVSAPAAMERAIVRMDKILLAMARCKWYEFQRRKDLLLAMKKTLNYMKRRF